MKQIVCDSCGKTEEDTEDYDVPLGWVEVVHRKTVTIMGKDIEATFQFCNTCSEQLVLKTDTWKQNL